MPRRTDTTIVAVKLRIREGLRKMLLQEAEKAGRSLNQELERRLERSFELEQRL
jgi:predicted HicB family RNase H-like nuclease